MLTVKRLYASFFAALAGLLITSAAFGADTNVPTNGNPPLYYDGSGFAVARTPDKTKTFSAVTITSATALWTPTSGTRFRLQGFCIAAGATAGAVQLQDGGVTFLIVPVLTANAPLCHALPANGYQSTAENNVLTAIGASGEAITGYVIGDEEP